MARDTAVHGCSSTSALSDFDKQFLELGRDTALHDNPLCTEADLAMVQKRAFRTQRRGLLQIRVVEDHGGAFAAELHEARL